MKILICEICLQEIAQFDPEYVALPLRGEMFGPLPHLAEMGAPFFSFSDYLDFQCPYCRKVPFIVSFNSYADTLREDLPEKLLTPEGDFNLKQARDAKYDKVVHDRVTNKNDMPSGVSCRYCGKTYKPKGIKRHEFSCKKTHQWVEPK